MEQWSEEALRLETPSPTVPQDSASLGGRCPAEQSVPPSRALHALVWWPCQTDRAALTLRGFPPVP